MLSIEESIELLQNTHKIQVQRNLTRLSFGNYDECRSLLERAFLYCDKSVKKFDFLPEYEEVVKWLVDNEGKGLLLMGKPGLGKSVIATGVIPAIFHNRLRKVLKPTPAEEIPLKIETIIKQPFYCIDDIGIESKVNDFGEKYEGFNRIVNESETRFKLLIVTTNLNPNQLLDRYGERTVDRLRRLCKLVKLEGESKRW